MRIESLELLESQGGQDRSSPGTKILGGDVFPADLFEIGIDIGRRDVSLNTALIDILKKLLSRQLLACSNYFGDSPIFDSEAPGLATLTLELKAQFCTIHLHVLIEQCGETVAFILLGVVIIPDPDERCFQKVHYRG